MFSHRRESLQRLLALLDGVMNLHRVNRTTQRVNDCFPGKALLGVFGDPLRRVSEREDVMVAPHVPIFHPRGNSVRQALTK